MLYNLEPSREITGGAYYTGSEYNGVLIDNVRKMCLGFVQAQVGLCVHVDSPCLPSLREEVMLKSSHELPYETFENSCDCMRIGVRIVFICSRD